MSYVRGIYARYAVLIGEVIKFGIVGGTGFVVQVGISDWLHLGLGVGATTATISGYVIATVVTFLGNRFWAFNRRTGGSLRRETILFCLFNVAGIVIQVGAVDIATYGFSYTDALSYNIATVLGIILATIFRLFSYRQWVFSTPRDEVAADRKQPTPVG